MKAIIKTFSTQECEKIFNGEMTVIACKPAPKIEPPFKVYVYRTKDKVGKAIVNEVLNGVYGGGKVIGEFVYDEKMNITKVKLYGNIKEIKKFRRPCINEDLRCTKCPKCRKAKNGRIQCYNIVTRAPKNWCYVVEE